jgi:uracil-DNA glycosylase
MAVEAVPESWRPAVEPVLATREARQAGRILKAEGSGGQAHLPPRGSRCARSS